MQKEGGAGNNILSCGTEEEEWWRAALVLSKQKDRLTDRALSKASYFLLKQTALLFQSDSEMPHLKKKSVDYFKKKSIFITKKSLLEKSYLFAFHLPWKEELCISVMLVLYTTLQRGSWFVKTTRWILSPTRKNMSFTVLDSKVNAFSMFWFLKHNIIPILIISLIHMDSSCLRKEKNTFVF